MRTRFIRLGLIALLISAFGVATVTAAAGKLQPVKNPAPASAFTLRDANGKLTSLADFEGKVVLLNFWATWCVNCRKEMPAMERLYQSVRADGFEIVAVSVDRVSTEKVKAFAQELKLTFPVLHDRDSIISSLYSNPGVPVSYLIDRRGRITHRVLGEYDWSSTEARAAVKGLLQETGSSNEG